VVVKRVALKSLALKLVALMTCGTETLGSGICDTETRGTKRFLSDLGNMGMNKFLENINSIAYKKKDMWNMRLMGNLKSRIHSEHS
jgi:hypothetical protein